LVHECGEAFLVGVDGGFGAFQVATPFTERLNEGVQYLFLCKVACDCRWVFAREEADGVC
jgi:hypothetical protein